MVSGGKEGVKPDFGSVLLEYCGMIALRRDDWGRDISVHGEEGRTVTAVAVCGRALAIVYKNGEIDTVRLP